MINPPLNKLMEMTDSRYTLVVEAAKRSRQLIDGDAPLVEGDISKPVTVAINEIYEGRVHYQRTKDGIK